MTRLIQLNDYQTKVRDALMEACQGSRRAKAQIKAEAFTTSDFPLAFQKVNQLVLQDRLAEYQPVWPSVAKRRVMDNLKPARSARLDIDTTNLPANNGGYPRVPATLPRIPEGTEYPGFAFTQSEYEYGTAKNGGRIAFTWEAFETDDWEQIASLPDQMKELAVNTEETEAFRQYYSIAGGFNQRMFVQAQNLPGNAALGLDSLQAAVTLATQDPPTPAGNRPRVNLVDRWALLVPVGLKRTAQQILNITQIKKTDANGNEYLTTPELGDITVVGVPWINYLTANGSYARTTGWALVPYGGESAYGETVINAYLRGRETPQMRIKNDQGQALGGGELSPYEGDFDADSIQVRIAQWVKGNAVSNFGCVWSKGDGTAGTTTA